MALFTGSGVAIVTPFDEREEVNYNKLEELIDYQIDNKTDAIIICGTTGETPTLTKEEHIECIKVAVNRTKGRVPVIAGAGSNSTRHAIEVSKEAQKAGADGLLVVTPYYNKTTQNGLVQYFSAIANSVDLPVIMYNVPVRTGLNMTSKTVAELRKVENITGIKEASGNISQVMEIMHLCNGDIDLYSGNDDQIVPLLSAGGKGVISVVANILPEDTHNIVTKFLEGDVKGSLDIQLRMLPVINALFYEVNPIPVKKALNLMGFNVGSLRSPLLEMENANAERLISAMRNYGISLA